MRCVFVSISLSDINNSFSPLNPFMLNKITITLYATFINTSSFNDILKAVYECIIS